MFVLNNRNKTVGHKRYQTCNGTGSLVKILILSVRITSRTANFTMCIQEHVAQERHKEHMTSRGS